LLRASDTTAAGAMGFLNAARTLVAAPAGIVLQPPVPASMARRADRHHAQMLVESASRTRLQQFLSDWVPRLADLPSSRSLRWALDVDPLDVF
jgi:primosomal protein N' (replication factor Y)